MLKLLDKMVGARGFEPPTPSLPDERETLKSFGEFRKPNESIGADSNRQISADVNRHCVHFVRFSSLSDQRFHSAARAFGWPDFLHRHWDNRAQREIATGDLVVFAKGDADQPTVPFNGNDEAYA